MRGQRLVGELETHLVVALAGAAVRQRVAAGGERHLHLPLGEQRAGDRGAEQVLMLVNASRAHQAPQILRDELFAQVGDVHFGCARGEGFLLQAAELVAPLADVAAHRDHLAVVVFLEPGNDDGRVQTAGIREGYFFRFHVL